MRYRITINWKGEIHKLYTTCDGKDKALSNAISRLARLLGVNRRVINNYINEGKDRWKINSFKH